MRTVVTGATGTLGTTIAIALAEQDHRLIMVGRSSDKLERLCASLPHPSDHSIVAQDLADGADPSTFMPNIPIDALVNVAAEQGAIGPSWAIDPTSWQRTLAVNFIAPVALCAWSVPRMGKARRGKIVNISGGGATNARPNFAPYACSKTALVRFSETLAAEAPHIDVNAVAPGQIYSAMTEEVIAAWADRPGDRELDEALRIKNEPSGNEHKTAELVRHLLSPDSDGISGRLISAVWDDWRNLGRELHADKFKLRRVV